MIELDRDAPLPLADQLVEAMRYEIASGKYRPGARLPSTRDLGDQLGISFHTARKAYQKLAEEGLLDVRRGGGYIVIERQILSRAERLERGAGVVQEALHKLVGLGLNDAEVDYAVQEAVQFFERPGTSRSLAFVADYRELAESGAEQSAAALQERVAPALLADVPGLARLDGLVAPLPLLHRLRPLHPDTDRVGVVVDYPYDVLERTAGLGAGESLGLVTRHPDAVIPLSDDLRRRTGFAGQILGLPVDGDRRQLDTVLRQATLVLYTPQARRRVRPLLMKTETAHAEATATLAPDALARLREVLGA